MSFLLNEPLIIALHERLVSELATEVEAINARDTLGVHLDPPKAILDFVPQGELIDNAGFPCFGIGDLPSKIEDDTGFSVTLRAGLHIVTYDQHSDQRALAWRLRRYQQAVTTCALRTRRLDDQWGIVGKGTIPGPTLGRETDPAVWESWCAVAIEGRSDDG